MNETEFRILDILSQEIGNPASINKLTEKIKRVYGTAHYANIHAELQNIAKKNMLRLTRSGNSTITELNFGNNYLLADLLSEMEIIKKIRFLENNPDYQLVTVDLDTYIKDSLFVKFLLLVEPNRNAKLNRMELVWILKESSSARSAKEIHKIRSFIEKLQQSHNIKIDCLFLSDQGFIELLKMDDANTAKEVLSDKIVLFHPQTLWMEIKEILGKGIRVKIEEQKIHPAKIREVDLVFNLTRLGYREMGSRIFLDATPIGIEYIVTSVLIKKDSIRRLEAIPIILAKNNEKINYSLLVFLATKFQVIHQLCDIFKILDVLKPTKEVQSVIRGISEFVTQKAKVKQKIIPLNLKDMEKKMRLYDVIE